MAPLIERRLTPERGPNDWHLPVKANVVIHHGALVAIDANGFAIPAATATGLKAGGRAEERADNSGGQDGDVLVKVRRGIFKWANSAAGDEITKADVGNHAFIVDDQTVAKTDGSGTRSIAGRIEDVEPSGVWVATGQGVLNAPGGALLAANNLSDLGAAATARANLNVAIGMGAPTFTIGDEAANTINVAVQLKDAAGDNLAVRGSVMAYLSTDAGGANLAATAPDGGVTIGTMGLAVPLVAGKAFQLVSHTDGIVDLNIEESGAATFYLVVVLPHGRLAVSDAITFAD